MGRGGCPGRRPGGGRMVVVRPGTAPGRAGEAFDAHPASDVDAAAWPALEFGFHDAVWVSDGGGAATIFARDSAAARRLAAVLEGKTDIRREGGHRAARPDHADAVFLAGARKILDYLVAGDVYQVNRRGGCPPRSWPAAPSSWRSPWQRQRPPPTPPSLPRPMARVRCSATRPSVSSASTATAAWRRHPSKACGRALPIPRPIGRRPWPCSRRPRTAPSTS